ncbi:MAG: hypothetical protein ACFFCS_24535 [Candidatus Hodarchaeota archaeon]
MEKNSDIRIYDLKKKPLFQGLVFGLVFYFATIFAVVILLYIQGWFGQFGFTNFLPLALIFGAVAGIGLGIIFLISILIIKTLSKWPRLINATLKLHRIFQRGPGLYYIIKSDDDAASIGIKTGLSRSIYGALLILGVSFRIATLQFIGLAEFKAQSSMSLLIIDVCILPLILCFFYVSPWVIRESSVFHARKVDRTVRNVGDWLEDFLEFFVGLDIIITLIEFYITIQDVLWFLITLMLTFGPLLAIVLIFTVTFFFFKHDIIIKYRLFLESRNIKELEMHGDEIKTDVMEMLFYVDDKREEGKKAKKKILAGKPKKQEPGKKKPEKEASSDDEIKIL